MQILVILQLMLTYFKQKFIMNLVDQTSFWAFGGQGSIDENHGRFD